jgi:drug/metabolite transporter (DMT)-like permease
MGQLAPQLRIKLVGIALMIAAMQVVSLNDALAKILVLSLPVAFVAAMRPITQSMFLLGHVGVSRGPLRMRELANKVHVLRGFLWWLATVLFFYAIQDSDIPVVLALFFAGPLFVALSAPLFLREPFEARFVIAAGVGFIGALIILWPSGATYTPKMPVALLSGISYSGYLMATRHVSQRRNLSATEIALGAGIWASLLSLPLAVWQLSEAADNLNAQLILLICGMGFLSALGHWLIAMASQRVSATNLAPYTYTELFGAIVASLVIFGTLPSSGAWLGIALICGGGVWAALKSRQRKTQEEIDPPV